ncbi:MAG: hypothetical protein LUD47_02655 [Clostridia bacterium]|nr:hypothetical protein [Clostridia bacterium]
MIEFTTQDMVAYLMEDYGLDMAKAFDVVFTSNTYKQLENLKTGLYLEESPYTYEYLKKEPDFLARVNSK